MTRYGWIIVAGIAAAMAAGCGGEISPQARQALQNGYDAYRGGDDAAAVRILDEFILWNNDTARTAEAYYLRGLARYRLKQTDTAGKDFQAAAEKATEPSVRAHAMAALGDLAYDRDDALQAERLYRQALADTPRGTSPADQAHYRLGCLLQQQGRWAEADLQFSRVMYLFKESPLARLSADRLHAVAWTIQAGLYADKSQAVAKAQQFRAEPLAAQARAVLGGDGQTAYAVQVGRYSTIEQARSQLAAVRVRCKDAVIITMR